MGNPIDVLGDADTRGERQAEVIRRAVLEPDRGVDRLVGLEVGRGAPQAEGDDPVELDRFLDEVLTLDVNADLRRCAAVRGVIYPQRSSLRQAVARCAQIDADSKLHLAVFR